MFKLTLNRVHDTVKINEGDEALILRLLEEPTRMVAGLSQAQKMLKEITETSTQEERRNAALYFATVIFGKEQAEKLAEFYRNDEESVIVVCGRYFSGRLVKLITKAQKKTK